MALKHVNERSDLLRDYRLVMHHNDSGVSVKNNVQMSNSIVAVPARSRSAQHVRSHLHATYQSDAAQRLQSSHNRSCRGGEHVEPFGGTYCCFGC